MFANEAPNESSPVDLQSEPGVGPTDRATRSLSIVLIDPRALTRRCLSYWLESSGHEFKITSVASAAQAIRQSGSVQQPGLILLCIGAARVASPEVRHDIDLVVRCGIDVPVALLADHEEIDDIGEAIQRGVRGFLSTSLDLAEAAEALCFIRAGGTFVPASALVRLAQDMHRTQLPPSDKDKFQRLTPRETEVLARLRQGKPNKTIARELQISESTVKVFVCRILTKLDAKNRTEVAYLAQALPSSGPYLNGDALAGDAGAPSVTDL